MNPEKVIRLPHNHLIYVKEYIRTGDKERAYGKAYPNSQPQSRKPAAWRLSRRPEIQELIEEKQKESIEKGFAAAEAEAAERIKNDFLSLYERRAELARIVRRQARMNKYYKFKDEVKTMDVPVDNPSAILRAIELDTKLEAEYFAKKPAAEKNKNKEQDEEPFNLRIYIDKSAFGGDEDDLTDEEYDYAIKQSLANTDYIVVPPTLPPQLERLDCYVHRDMETGKYEIHCPADKVLAKEETGKIRLYDLTKNEDEKQVTSTALKPMAHSTKSKKHSCDNLRLQCYRPSRRSGNISIPPTAAPCKVTSG